MTITQQAITIGLCVLGTMATRFLPFIIFNEKRKTPAYVQYLGKYLPELLSILATAALHLWKREMLISIAGGTIVYMFIMNFVMT